MHGAGMSYTYPVMKSSDCVRDHAQQQHATNSKWCVSCRALLRRYPDFPDMRAALAAADWSIGKLGDAESNYQRLNDPRYRDRDWLKVNRRWPPKLLSAWEAFLDIKKVAVS